MRLTSKYGSLFWERILLVALISAAGAVIVKYILYIKASYRPDLSDEIFYFVNAKSFYLNTSLEAALTYGGKGSTWLGADAHGFAYTLLQGGIAKLVGWNDMNFIVINFVLLALSIGLVLNSKVLSGNNKLFAVAFILLYPFVGCYAFTFMQEMIHVFIAIALSYLMHKLYNEPHNGKWLVCFILVVFAAGLFRSLWFFWLLGLLPLANNWKLFLAYGAIAFIGIVFSMLATKHIMEEIPNFFSIINQLLLQKNYALLNTVMQDHILFNINVFFNYHKLDTSWIVMHYFTIGSILYFLVLSITRMSRLYLAVFLIILTNFVLLIVLYDAFGFREIRTLAPAYYFSILFFLLSSKQWLKYLALAALVIGFVRIIPFIENWVVVRNFQHKPVSISKQAAFQSISNVVKDNSIVYFDYLPKDGDYDLLHLPLQNKNKSPIRYAVPYYKIPLANYHYIISPADSVKASHQLVMRNNYFNFYEN